jgi:hypothetical protein
LNGPDARVLRVRIRPGALPGQGVCLVL